MKDKKLEKKLQIAILLLNRIWDVYPKTIDFSANFLEGLLDIKIERGLPIYCEKREKINKKRFNKKVR